LKYLTTAFSFGGLEDGELTGASEGGYQLGWAGAVLHWSAPVNDRVVAWAAHRSDADVSVMP
jgi:hypothetical protein